MLYHTYINYKRNKISYMSRNLDVRDYFLFALTAKTARNIIKNYDLSDYYISFNNVYDTCVSIANETLANRQNSNGVGKYIPSEPVTIEAYANAINDDKVFFWFDNFGVIVVTEFMEKIANKLRKENRLDTTRLEKEPMSIFSDVKKACKDIGVIKFEKDEDFEYSDFLIDVVNTVFTGTDSSNPVLGDE